MASTELDVESMTKSLSSTQISEANKDNEDSVQITCFSEVVNDVTLQFQIMRFPKQVQPPTLLSYPSPSQIFDEACETDARYMRGLVATLLNLDTYMQQHLQDL